MSYVNVPPAYYYAQQPDTIYRAGSRGWESARVPGWGENPNSSWPKHQGVNGLGAAACTPPTCQPPPVPRFTYRGSVPQNYYIARGISPWGAFPHGPGYQSPRESNCPDCEGWPVSTAIGNLESALEEASGWLEEFAPGHLSDLKEEYEDALKEAREELGADADEEELQEKARDIAETDMTYTEAGYINSSEWWGGEARGPLASAAEYAASALHAASYNSYDMIPIRPLGKGEGERVELEEADILKLYADGDLGLTQQDIARIADAEEGAVIDLKGFKLERVG